MHGVTDESPLCLACTGPVRRAALNGFFSFFYTGGETLPKHFVPNHSSPRHCLTDGPARQVSTQRKPGEYNTENVVVDVQKCTSCSCNSDKYSH